MKLRSDVLAFIETQGQVGSFNQLALSVFAEQYAHCPKYAQYCRQLSRTPEAIDRWEEIPPVPTDAFKMHPLCTFDPKEAPIVFQTSGTTHSVQGQHYYRNLNLFDASIDRTLMRGMHLTTDRRWRMRVLAPSWLEAPHSSLSYMLYRAVACYGDVLSHFYIRDTNVAHEELAEDLEQDIQTNTPVVLMGTAFALVAFFETYPDLRWPLPSGSRVMETGGLKGRTREVSQETLYDWIQDRFGLEESACISEYSMTELSSQCYSQGRRRLFSFPPWMPIRIVDPKTEREVEVGETGCVQCFDLANFDTVSAILTADLAIRHPNGFELKGRMPNATLRGCSTAFDLLSGEE